MLKPFSRSNPCPICDGGADCRYDTEGNLILCHGHIDFDPDHPDWHFTRPSDTGVWGVFVPRRDERFDRDRWLEQKAERELKQQREREARALDSLPIEERDRAIRSLSSYIGLSGRHKQDLIDRGLTDSQIKAGLFFSVDPGDRVPAGTPANLAGVVNGKIAASRSGYACIAFDRHGRATGWQVRLDKATDGNKYRWAKGTHSSHLPNGELPITVVNPDSLVRPNLGFCEGILKPRIAANRWGQRFIGASGGHFSGSREQIKEIIAREKKRLKNLSQEMAENIDIHSVHTVTPQPVIDIYNLDSGVTDDDILLIVDFYPDAGDLVNPSLVNQWKERVKFFESLGCSPRFIFWGQIEKTDNDCDELTDDQIGSSFPMTPDDFFLKAYREQTKKNWEKAKTFSPEIEINQEWVKYSDFPSEAITLLKSPLGTGKTANLVEWVGSNFGELRSDRLILLGYRNNLLIQTIERINTKTLPQGKKMTFHEEIPTLFLDYSDTWTAACINSLLRFPLHFFDSATIVLDETASILKHLLYSTTIKEDDRLSIIERFKDALNRCDRVICLDGNMQDWATEFFKKIAPQKKIRTIGNIFSPIKPKIDYLLGADCSNFIRSESKGGYYRDVVQDGVCNGQKLIVGSDSQITLETLDEQCQAKGKKGLRIDNKTSSTPTVRAFLANPNEWIIENNPDYILYSPSCESGIDISIEGYFDAHYCFFFGVLDADSILQMIARVRDVNVPKRIWVSHVPRIREDESNSPAVEILKKALNDRISIDMNRALCGETRITAETLEAVRKSIDEFDATALTIKAIRNYESRNLRECVKFLLEKSGYEVSESYSEYVDNETFNQTKETVQRRECADIFDAPEPSEEGVKVEASNGVSWTKQCTETKRYYYDRLPDIKNKSGWSIDLIYYLRFEEKTKEVKRDGVSTLAKIGKINPIERLEKFYLLEHPEITQKLALKKFAKWHSKALSGEKIITWDYKNTESVINALRASGINELITHGTDKTYQADDPIIKEIIAKCRKKAVSLVIGHQGKLSDIQFIGKILARVGYRWECKMSKVNGKAQRHYQCVPDEFVHKHKYSPVVSECIRAKWDNFLSQWEEIDWENHGRTAHQDNPETRSQQALEQVTPQPVNDIYNLGSGVTARREMSTDGVACSIPDPLADLYKRGRGETGDFPEPEIRDIAEMIATVGPGDEDCWQFLRTFPPRAIYLAIESGRESIVPPRKATLARAG